jgi:hypothetical protein
VCVEIYVNKYIERKRDREKKMYNEKDKGRDVERDVNGER